MSKSVVICIILVAIVSVAFAIVIYRGYIATPYKMAWDMAAHTYYGAELAQDIRHGHPIAFLDHMNNSSIALWPFFHSLMLSLWFLVFGFSDKVAVFLTIVFSSLCITGGSIATWLSINKKSVIPGLLFAFFFISSPLFIAFSNYVMLEIFGAFFMLLIIIMVSLDIEYGRRWSHRLIAISFLLLFLIKINYGIYIFIPYLIFEFANLSGEKRKEYRRIFLQFLDLKNPKNIWNAIIALNIVFLIVMNFLSGFRFNIFGHEIEASGTKNLIYLLLCLVFLKSMVFYIKQNRLVSDTLLSRHISIIHILIIPIFLWFLINPGRLPEFIRMSADRKTDFSFIGFRNLLFYPKTFITDYCCHPALGIMMIVFVIASAIRWKKNPLSIRFLLIIILFGYVGLTFKLSNFAGARFIFVQVPAVFIVSAFEIWRTGNDLKGFNRFLHPLYYLILTAAIIVLACFPVRNIYTSEMPLLIRKSAPTMSPRLQRLMDKAIKAVEPDEKRICILGGSNEISPYLAKWSITKIHPDMYPVYIEPPIKSASKEEERALLENWLSRNEADVIVVLEILGVSPFAQTDDFKTFHSEKQALVKFMEKQEIYYLAEKAGWGSMAAGIKLYKPRNE